MGYPDVNTRFCRGLLVAWALGAGLLRGATALDLDVVLSEVHYHPHDAAGDALEFVELHNAGSTPVDLGGWAFVDGIVFAFPAGTYLDAGGYLAIASDAEAVRAAARGGAVLGSFSGHLDNGGEILRLVNAGGETIAQVHYRDGKGWPGKADGKGPSLERLVLHGDGDRPQVWASSRFVGGTPGLPNSRTADEYPQISGDGIGSVRLNEIRPADQGSLGFVELLNLAPTQQDLSRARLVAPDGSAGTFPEGVRLAPGERTSIGLDALGLGPGGSAGVYLLVARDGVTHLDALETRGIPSGASTGRFPDGGDDGWILNPTPGSANARTLEDRVVINELFFAPRYEPPGQGCTSDCADRHQWVELVNRGPGSVDLSGWTLDRAVTYTFPAGTQLAEGAFLVVVSSQVAFAADHPGVAAAPGEWKGSLGSREDTLILRDVRGNEVGRAHYGNGNPYNDDNDDGRDDGTVVASDWPTAVSDSGRSIELANPLLAAEAGRSWRLGPTGGTPRAVNSRLEATPPPVVARVQHEPGVPTSVDPVRVTCKAFAAEGIESVAVIWRVDGQAATQRVSLLDNGLDGDVAGDHIHSGVIPPAASGTTIAFQILVTARSGSTATYPPRPATGDRTPFYLYEVDDEEILNGSPSYRVILTRSDLDLLKSRPLQSNVLLNCTFIGNGSVHHQAAIRYRGENSRNLERKSYRVEFPPEDRFEGLETINLNASNGGNPPTTSVRDLLSAELFRRAGLPYPQEWPVNLHLSGGVRGDGQGHPNLDPFYVCKETFSRDFLSRYFGGSDGGNLYRPRDPQGGGSGDLGYLGEDEADYVPFYEKRSNRDADDYSDLIELVRGFDRNETPDAVFESEMVRLLDVKEWATFFALEDYLTNIDGAIQTNNGEDYLLYHVPEDSGRADAGKWLVLPWDLEETFDSATAGYFITQVAAARRFLRHAAFAPHYLTSLLRTAEAWAALPGVQPLYGYIQDVYPPGSSGDVSAFFDNYFTRRSSHVLTQVGRDLAAAVAQESVGGTKWISEGDTWSYFKGTREPSGGTTAWAQPNFADGGWETGSSGFGYGDNDDATTLDDMQQRFGNAGYSSLYVRTRFQVEDPAAVTSLTLVVDYDDAFVAYLNGSEIARSPNLAGTGAKDQAVPFDSEFGNNFNHEASRGGNGASPPGSFPVADFRTLLGPGANVLAIHGLNGTRDSSDFSLIPELIAETGTVSGGAGWGSTLIVSGPTAKLRGVAPGAAGSVKVGTVVATVTDRPPAGGTPYQLEWTASVTVNPGANRLGVVAYSGLRGEGDPVETREIVVWRIDRAFTPVSGALAGEVTWSPAGGPYLLQGEVRVPAGAHLVLQPGSQVLFGPTSRLLVEGTFEALGTEGNPIHLGPGTFGERWNGIVLSQTGTVAGAPIHRLSHVVLELADTPTGRNAVITARSSRLVIEDSRFDGCLDGAVEGNAASLEIRRSVFSGPGVGLAAEACSVLVEDSTFTGMTGQSGGIVLTGNGEAPARIVRCRLEGIAGNGLECRGASADVIGSWFRRAGRAGCLVTGPGLLGPVTLDGCVLAESTSGLELRGQGALVSAGHLSVLWCGTGLLLAGDSSGAASAAIHSSIVWNNARDISLGSRFTLSLDHSDVDDEGPWPGEGNLSLEPRLLEPGGDNFSLAPDSPCRRSGRDGTDMGVTGSGAAAASFLRGDVNADGSLNLTDGISVLNYLFRGQGTLDCTDAADSDDNGQVNLTDVISLLNFLFRGGAAPPAPYPASGPDPTADDLDCLRA